MDDPQIVSPTGPDQPHGSDDDLQVLNEILSAFGKLQPESREKILNIVATYYGVGAHRASAFLGPPLQGSATRSETTFSEDRSPSPKQFMFEKQPKTDVERVACLAYYLTHYRDAQFFKTLDISTLNTEAAQLKFSNAAFAVENATKLNYLAPGTKGTKQLSARGEQFVLALPDREKARGIMAGGRARRTARKNLPEAGENPQ